MSEYVYGTDGHEGHWLTGEEIVRCRDCKYRRKWKKYWWCELSELFYSEQIPDGFCAWGERKVVSE